VPTGLAYTWGTSERDRSQPFPCDQHLPDAEDAYFRAVDFAAPPGVLFRSASLGRRRPGSAVAGALQKVDDHPGCPLGLVVPHEVSGVLEHDEL
jgi:hypothetical protein